LSSLDKFEDFYAYEYINEIENMINAFRKLNVTCGQLTPKGYINAMKKWGTRGYFYICFFINLTKEANTNILIAFPRYEGY
jgi:hypothetical protein